MLSQPLNVMEDTINKLVVKEKGILALDESIPTIGKRFAAINLDNNPTNRARYRSLCATTKDLSKYISGVILFEETLTQQIMLPQKELKFNKNNDITIAAQFATQGIVIGIKVDQGLAPLKLESTEKITLGLDALTENLFKFKSLGAKFAKWRAVISIDPGQNFPSNLAIKINSWQLARYAAICQSQGIVPIVEPEVLMEGSHDLDLCAEVTEKFLTNVFEQLRDHQVHLEYMLLKPNMILPGKNHQHDYPPMTIATETLKVLKRTVPAAVPSINFLSGGQSESAATDNLTAINKLGLAPWHLSFSFGRALQDSCMQAWQGKDQNINLAQKSLAHRARLNSMANFAH